MSSRLSGLKPEGHSTSFGRNSPDNPGPDRPGIWGAVQRGLRSIYAKDPDELMRFSVRQRVYLINVSLTGAVILLIPFIFLNILRGHWTLLAGNFAIIIPSLIILRKPTWKKHPLTLLLLLTLPSLMYTGLAFVYRNGGQYALIFMMANALLLIENKVQAILVSALAVVLLVGYEYLHYYYPPPHPVTPLRSALAVISFVAIYPVFFWSYRGLYERHEKKISETNILQKKLFSILSHDLRAPIASVRTALNVYEVGEMSKEELMQVLGGIGSELDKLQLIVDDLIHWAMSQQQKISPNVGVHLAHPVLEDCARLLALNSLQKRLDVVVAGGHGCRFQADRDHVALIMRNLLSNAIKFSKPEGRIELTCETIDGSVALRIRDYGVGMPAQRIRELLSNPINTSTPGTMQEKGTGLGMELVKSFVELNQGRLEIESEPDKGTCVTVLLPTVTR